MPDGMFAFMKCVWIDNIARLGGCHVGESRNASNHSAGSTLGFKPLNNDIIPCFAKCKENSPPHPPEQQTLPQLPTPTWINIVSDAKGRRRSISAPKVVLSCTHLAPRSAPAKNLESAVLGKGNMSSAGTDDRDRGARKHSAFFLANRPHRPEWNKPEWTRPTDASDCKIGRRAMRRNNIFGKPEHSQAVPTQTRHSLAVFQKLLADSWPTQHVRTFRQWPAMWGGMAYGKALSHRDTTEGGGLRNILRHSIMPPPSQLHPNRRDSCPHPTNLREGNLKDVRGLVRSWPSTWDYAPTVRPYTVVPKKVSQKQTTEVPLSTSPFRNRGDTIAKFWPSSRHSRALFWSPVIRCVGLCASTSKTSYRQPCGPQVNMISNGAWGPEKHVMTNKN